MLPSTDQEYDISIFVKTTVHTFPDPWRKLTSSSNEELNKKAIRPDMWVG